MSPIVKRKENKQKFSGKYLLLIYTFVSLLIMGLTFTGAFSDNIIRKTFGTAVVPFEKGLTNACSYVKKAISKQKTIDELTAENEALNEQINSLIEENTNLQHDAFELQNLRALYELDQTYHEYNKVGARVISWNTDNFYNSFIVDKGENDGIAVDMNVLCGTGLVGRITEVGPNWSLVTSIIEDNANVSAYVLHTGDNLIVSGDMKMMNQGLIRYSKLIDNEGKVKEGDKVVTSYISDKYLPGILVGYISTIELSPNQITKSGYITPTVDFSHISEVLIITELKENVSPN